MNLKVQVPPGNGERRSPGGTVPTDRANQPAFAAKPDEVKRFRRLNSNELVVRGDFVADGRQKLQLWEGLTGFRADSFVSPIYRQLENRPRKSKGSK